MSLHNDPELYYIPAGVHSYTFNVGKVKEFVGNRLSGDVLNLFAGKHQFTDVNETRVDLDPEMPSLDYCGDAHDYLKMCKEKEQFFDYIIWDPPWNERKAKEYYDGRYIGKFTKMKDDAIAVLKPGGAVVTLGYEITNMGKGRGTFLDELAVVDPKGEIRPYFISIERKFE